MPLGYSLHPSSGLQTCPWLFHQSYLFPKPSPSVEQPVFPRMASDNSNLHVPDTFPSILCLVNSFETQLTYLSFQGVLFDPPSLDQGALLCVLRTTWGYLNLNSRLSPLCFGFQHFTFLPYYEFYKKRHTFTDFCILRVQYSAWHIIGAQQIPTEWMTQLIN